MSKPTHILIVEDQKADFDLACHELGKAVEDCVFAQVETRQGFLEALRTFQPDVILSDYSMPSFDGLSALKLTREQAPLTPFIIWTGSMSEDVAVECMKAGASNYILKENLKRLGPAVVHAVEEGQLLLERIQTEQRLHESEERYRTFVEQSTDGLAIIDEDGFVIEWNQALSEIMDLPHEQAIGMSMLDVQIMLTPPEKRTSLNAQDLRSLFLDILKTGASPYLEKTLEEEIQTASGKRKFIQQISFPIRTARGFRVGSFIRDITDRRQAEIEIQQRTDDLQLINTVNEAVIRGEDLNGIVNLLAGGLKRIFPVNGSTVYMLGPDGNTLTMQQYNLPPEMTRQIEKVIGSTIPLVQIPIQEGGVFQKVINSRHGIISSDPEQIMKWMEEFVETSFLPGTVRPIIRKIIPQLFKILNIKSTIMVPLILEGRIIGLLDISSTGLFTEEDLHRIENISRHLTAAIQRQQSIEQVERSQAFLQSVQNALSASIAILDERGVIIQVNSAWRKFGEKNGLLHPEYCIGLNYLDVCDSATGPDAGEAQLAARGIREVIAGHRHEFEIEYPCHSPEEKRWFILRITKFDDGENIWVVLAHENITERKKVEEAFKETSEQFRTLFEASPDAILLIEPRDEWRIVGCNTAACQINGYTRDELIGQSINILNLSSGSPTERSKYLEKIRASNILRFEDKHRRKDGTIFPVEVSTSLITVGGREMVLGIDRDITERKQADEKLRRSESRYRTVVENQTDFIVRWNANGVRTFINDAYCHYYGLTVTEALTTGFLLLVYPADRPAVEEKISRLLTGKVNIETDIHRVIRPDGSIGWQEWTDKAIHDQNGQVIEFQSIGRDITERKQAEEELRASEERFRQLADNIQEVFWMTDAVSGERIYISPASEQVWGRSIDSMLHDPQVFVNSILPEDRSLVLEKIQAQRNGSRTDMEYRIVRPDGSVSWIWDRAFPIFDEAGKVVRLAGIAADITERKQSQERLRESEIRYRGLFDNLVIGFALHEIVMDEKGRPVDYIFLEINPMFEKLTGIRARDAIGRRVSEILPHVENERFIPVYGKVALTGEPVHLEEYSKDLNKYYEINAYSPKHGQFAVTFIDITERKQAEEDIARHLAEMEALYENGLAVGQLLNLHEIGERIIETFARYLSWHHVAIRLLQPGSDNLELIAFNQPGMSDEEGYGIEHRLQSMISKVGKGLSGWVVQTGKPFRTGNVHAHPQYVDTTHVGIQSGLYMPLNIGNQVIGVISVESEKTDAFTPQDERLLATLASQAAIAFENARLYQTNQKERERFSDLFENSPVATWLEDFSAVIAWMDGLRAQGIANLADHLANHHDQYQLGVSLIQILDVNHAAVVMNGAHNKEELIEKVYGLLMDETLSPVMIEELDLIWKGYTSFGFEMSSSKLDGSPITGIQRVHIPSNNDEPDYSRVIVTSTDITDRMNVEKQLRASEVHYRELADSITDLFFELDQDLRYSHWNRASEMLTGLSAEYAIGRSMRDVFGESEEQTRIGKIYKDVLDTHHPRTFETTLAVNNQQRTFEINAYPSTRGVAVVAKDVTERKLSESLMQKRFELMEYSANHGLEELMQKALNEISEWTGSSIGFFQLIKDDQVTPSLQIWSTDTFQQFHSSRVEDMHKPADQAGVWAEAIRQRRAVIHNDYEFSSLTGKKGLPEGHTPVIRELVLPIIRNEKIVAAIGVGNKAQDYTRGDLEITGRFADYAWDVIERKQMVNEIAEERNLLAKRVEDRTSDLSRANSNLARALRVKDEFLANMSHELRTPLNAILGLSESLSEQIAGPLNEKQQKYLNTISESGHHLLSLINDILDLAKIEAGQITLDINKVDIKSVSQASLRMIKQLAQKKNLEVSVEIDDQIGLMWADERRLKQMIVNLLSNAVKFTPEGGRLGLKVSGDQDENKVSFTVWDTGIGIKQSDFERLFQPFVQLDSGLARESSGTGLGLALVSQMARLHGGSINVESEAGQGSRFTIVLSWEPALAPDVVERMKTTAKFRTVSPGEVQQTILLVEDTQEVVMMIKDYLEIAGYKVATAQDGLDGITQAKFTHPDLILMDIQMPRMDGLEATKNLRKDPEFKYTPIIALTALAMPNDRERCLAAGMDEYISKPVNLRGLVRLVQSYLSMREEKTQPR